MNDIKKVVGIVLSVFVIGILASALFPMLIGAVSTDTQTNQLTELDTIELSGDLTATLDSVDDAGGEITVTVETDTDTDTVVVSEGSTSTATVDGTDVGVSADSIDSADSATVSFSWPLSYGWGVAGSLWVLIPFFIILPVFLFLVRLAISDRD